MSLQTDKQELNTKISRYMTLLSNLSNPPADYINDLDYFRGLVQIANSKEIDPLTQTWETIRPKDARSARYIETGMLGDGRAVELKALIDLTWAIMILRGGPTSGNWGHAGRKGKRGGSGRGGGFRKIGVKSGKAGRGKIKQASRQTRSKEERQRGGGVKQRSGEIPASTVNRAAGTVKKARIKRDKELKAARTGEKEIAKAKATGLKAQEKFFKSMDKEGAAWKKLQAAGDETRKAENELFSFIGTEGLNFLDPKVKAKSDKMSRKTARLRTKEEKLRESYQKIGKQNTANRDAYNEANANLQKISDKHKGARKAVDILNDYQKETDQASKVIFQHNLNEGKRVRRDIKNLSQSKEIKELEKRRDKQIAVSTRALASIKGVTDSEGLSKAERESNKLFEMDSKLMELRQEIPQRAKTLIKVDNPTTIRQAPGSQKDKTFNPTLKDRRKNGQAAFQEMVSEDVVPKGSLVKYQNTDTGRAFQRSGTISEVHMDVFSGADTVVHELGHTAENYNNRLLKRSLEFRDRRTAGEEYQPLVDLTGNQGYRKEEKAKPDKFIHPYMGKDYGKSASEIFSMGMEEMFRDPVGFAEKDPEMFDFIYAQARTP
jgi:hypothetical protein